MTARYSDTHSNTPSKQSRYRPEIDGLRAFAVVAVIINHFNKDILPGGYLGVDIFFVISGYVITSSLFGRPSKDFKDFISGFYERRIKRLVPALSVFVLITSVAICLLKPTAGSSLRTGLTSLFGLSNLYLLKQSTDYFAQSTELNIFTHTWSLGVEEQFYILFPFLIWFSGYGGQTKNGLAIFSS
ncbi:acyltransferase [Synechococcus sp. RS9902]|uniref:acyltransferase family protein n=1 Tax=Synechococcus sp. RS9902 TaxID=221345 RepID=UPI002106F8AB|nr:acyltransferase [Synechococcus sp. RS9902]